MQSSLHTHVRGMLASRESGDRSDEVVRCLVRPACKSISNL